VRGPGRLRTAAVTFKLSRPDWPRQRYAIKAPRFAGRLAVGAGPVNPASANCGSLSRIAGEGWGEGRYFRLCSRIALNSLSGRQFGQRDEFTTLRPMS
jgi:hypothetical protein